VTGPTQAPQQKHIGSRGTHFNFDEARTIGEEGLHEIADLALHVMLVFEVRRRGIHERVILGVVHALRRQRDLWNGETMINYNNKNNKNKNKNNT
jgi:hypothetical protein